MWVGHVDALFFYEWLTVTTALNVLRSSNKLPNSYGVNRLHWHWKLLKWVYQQSVLKTGPIKTEWTKKHSEVMQTLCAGCSKAEPKIFAPPQTPFPGGADWTKFNQLEMVTTLPTDPVWWRSMHAISSYCGNRPTHKNTHTNKPTDRTDYNTLRC